MKWNSVKVKLPKHGQTVLVSHKYGVNEAEFLFCPKAGFKTPTFDYPYYGQTQQSSFENVTHWMSMPRKAKGD